VPGGRRAGIILAQSPAGGTATRGSRVRISVAEGPNPATPATVPNVVGQDQTAAATALRQAGFKVLVLFRKTADQTKDGLAVDDLDLAIADGEFLVLVGPSGCGKTTALRCVAGLEEITSGRIKIGERVVNRVPSKDRNIAMVFQSYALYPHMTVYDNLAFGL